MTASLHVLFGCPHKKTTFPQTRRQREYVSGIQRPAGTFVSCLDCGREFAYDWQAMKIVKEKSFFSKLKGTVYGT